MTRLAERIRSGNYGQGTTNKATFARLKAADRYAARQLKKLRRAAGLGQKSLGKKIGFGHTRIQKYEYGDVRLSAGVIVILAAAIGVEPKDFFK